MRIILVCCVLLGFVASSGGQSGAADPYSINIVKFELQMRAGGRKVIHGFSQKRLYRLGDSVSIAILKILDEDELSRPEVVRDLLPIIRDAFEEPRLISIESDKSPRITMFLLDYVKMRIRDNQVSADIQETADYVTSKTGT